jgi:hypothetical protein
LVSCLADLVRRSFSEGGSLGEGGQSIALDALTGSQESQRVVTSPWKG